MFEEQFEGLIWGTYGKGGVEHCAGSCPRHRFHTKRLIDCDTEHLQMILLNQGHVYRNGYADAIRLILIGRDETPVDFSPEAERKLFEAVRNAPKWNGTTCGDPECKCTCLHSSHPVNHAPGCPAYVAADEFEV